MSTASLLGTSSLNNDPFQNQAQPVIEPLKGNQPSCPPEFLSGVSDAAFWNDFVSETVGADFLDVTKRTMQLWRQTGAGPPFFRISSRCIKYTRRTMKEWADARIKTSTSQE